MKYMENLKLALLWSCLLTVSLFSAAAFAWQDTAAKHIYGFRKDKHFAVSVELQGSNWFFEDKLYISTLTLASRAQFRFHLQLHKSLGYLVGSSFGTAYNVYHGFYVISLPSITTGLVWHLNPEWQALAVIEAHLDYIHDLPAPLINEKGVIIESARVNIKIEHYLSLTTAMHAHIGIVGSRILIERGLQGFLRQGLQGGVGLSYHLL
ncbi:MAG: hypothetical protein OYH77_08575 [Pseudomonadota bacterium]|nr:hypothetical protein [Pseudomonadota bacterium]